MEEQDAQTVAKDFYGCMEKIFKNDNSLSLLLVKEGDHFTEYGIYKNMILFFDSTIEHKDGCLAAYSDEKGNNYLSAEKREDRFVGSLVISMKGYGHGNDRTQESLCNC